MGEIKQYFDEEKFKKKDVVDISVDTTKEDELFDYVGYPRYYGVPKYNELDEEYEYDKNKDDDFDLRLQFSQGTEKQVSFAHFFLC